MRGSSHPRWATWVAVIALAALLAVLAVLQFRWTGEVSRAERERMAAGLGVAAGRFAEDFDRELTRALLHFLPQFAEGAGGGTEGWVRRLERWRETAPHPELVGGLYLASRDGEGPLGLADVAGGGGEIQWPASLEDLRRRLERIEGPPRLGFRGPRESRALVLAPEAPALVVPLFDRQTPRGGRGLSHFLVIALDLDFIRQQLLPLLGRRYLSAGGDPPFPFAVFLAGEPRRWIYSSVPEGAAETFRAGGDTEVAFFELLPREEVRKLWFDARLELPEPPPGPGRRPGEHWWSDPRLPAYRLLGSLLSEARRGDGGWRLVVRHPEGSLETAVRRARLRNLGVSFGVLLLLGLTVSMLLVASRRAERLARQQVELVAGITHELRTPVAAVASLGQNLADGIVPSEEQVRRYGRMIQREGARLARLVDQVLELAGIVSQRPAYRRRRTSVAEIVDGAVEDHRPLLEESGFRLDRDLPADLPPVTADAAALRRALGNLIHNAIKYGGEARWVGVRARVRAGPRGPEIAIEVADRGDGIPRQDLPHLFEPFYRGRNATGAQVQGSGLGLSLVRHIVEAHGGRIQVDSEPGQGSTFTLFLPAPEHPHGEPENPAD